MVSNTECDFLGEDRQLQVGQRVRAFWCKDGFYYHGEGMIIQLTREHISVQLQKSVAWSDEFKVGRTISLPRITNPTHWSTRNCVRPLKKMSLAS